ncbi:MAG TPA: hypothetical protein VI603_06890, partial [Saprospiraceae bacterium]|nr:hypothetical protein [Saprospiraceae bacterium]
MKNYFILIQVCLFVHANIDAQVGKVGINTTIPAAMLHVKDSSVVFTGISPLPGSPGNPPVSDAGTRMMWYPDKAAFRAGTVQGSGTTYWNKDSIGVYSIAFGRNTKANGSGSTAIGDGTIASGYYSTAAGYNTRATGNYSTALGNATIANGFVSTAIGYETMTSGNYSTAMGEGTNASGNTSTALGFNTKAKGTSSTALGNLTTAKSFASVVLGQFNDTTSISSTSWNLLDPVFIIGNGTADNARTNAFTVLKNGKTGINTKSPLAMLHVKDSSVLFTGPSSIPGPSNPPISGAGARMMWYSDKAAFRVGNVSGIGATFWNQDSIGLYSMAFGWNTQAKGQSSFASGLASNASGLNSTAIGSYTNASGYSSTAMGFSTNAMGSYSTSMGNSTQANGIYSTALGHSTTAMGSTSTAMGLSTFAKSFASLVIGQFNDTTAINPNSWNINDPVFIIGNGTANNARENAMTVLKNGKTGINTVSPDAMFHVVKNAASGGSYHSSSALIIESDQTSYLQFSNNTPD